MRVLVVSPSRSERDSIGRMFGHPPCLEMACDVPAAIACLARESPELVVVAWPVEGGPELLHRLRAGRGSPRPYVIGILDERQPSEIAGLYGSGADDFMRRPFTQEELLARASAPGRIRAWLLPDDTVVEALLRPLVNMGGVVGLELSGVVGEPLKVAEGWPRGLGELRGATIPLSLVSEGAELRVSVLAEVDSLAALGARLLGEPGAGEEALDDVLRELTNAAGGGVKRACLAEALTLTTGLPVTEAGVPPDNPTSRRWTAQAPGIRLLVAGQVRRRPKQRVTATCLVEGMILAQDVRTGAGALLVAAGTRLTRSNATRLARILGRGCLVEVAPAA